MSDQFRARIVIEDDNTDEVADRIRSLVRAVIKEATFGVEATAKTIVPVDTGNLKNSIETSFEADGDRGIVSTNVEYAPYIEFGTRFAPAQPFMQPAYDRVVPLVRKDLDEIKRSIQ